MPTEIVAIREQLAVSQSVFAQLLNVPKVTAISWEKGRRKPTGAALRLLDLVRKNPKILQEAFVLFVCFCSILVWFPEDQHRTGAILQTEGLAFDSNHLLVNSSDLAQFKFAHQTSLVNAFKQTRSFESVNFNG